MMKQEAVMNNIALLAHDISTMAADPHRLAEQAVDVVKTAGVILCLCSTGAWKRPGRRHGSTSHRGNCGCSRPRASLSR